MNAIITNIQGYSIHDGPGIRTVVFFKGCALSCGWCANPECISGRVQVGFIEKLCAHCGKCLSICPESAINLDESKPRIDYDRCNACGLCAENCYYDALVRYGKEMSVNEVFEVVARDKMFYGSEGGITASGGEPLLRSDFVEALFNRCKSEGISTCIETSGFAPSENLRTVLPVTDYVLFDIKHTNSELHTKYTGKPNDLILENAKIALGFSSNVLFRMPLIPSVNDDEENLENTAAILKNITQEPKLQIMPYHRLGTSKLKALNISADHDSLDIMKPHEIEDIKQTFIKLGIECTISK